MADILFIKTSSLGDVIHNMPALTDARRARPVDRFTWLVEEDVAPLVRLHPAVDEVVTVASRRWRRDGLWSPGAIRELLAFHGILQAQRFDAVIDTQGLFRTGLMAWFARGTRHGYDRASIREPLASIFYDIRHAVPRELHAVERNRRLAALALGYRPERLPDYGLNRDALRESDPSYAVLLHATARKDKEWPVENWVALKEVLSRRGVDLMLPWGNNFERTRAEQIARALPRAKVVERLPLDGVARLIAGAAFVIGVDTGIMHLAAALGVPLVAIFSGSQPALTGPVGNGPIEVVGAKGRVPRVEEVVQALNRLPH